MPLIVFRPTMPEQPDYYAILQVHPTADKEVIDAAYRKLASKYHPDVNKSAEATDKMKLLNEAYDILSDRDKRKAYDQRRLKVSGKNPLSSFWRSWVIPAGLILFIIIATRFGFKLALIFIVFMGVLWVVRRIGE